MSVIDILNPNVAAKDLKITLKIPYVALGPFYYIKCTYCDLSSTPRFIHLILSDEVRTNVGDFYGDLFEIA
jgi:hypothetical protein